VTTESPSFYTATATSVLQVVGEFQGEMKNNIMMKATLCSQLTSKERFSSQNNAGEFRSFHGGIRRTERKYFPSF
jgi:hypothetical protein